MLPAIYFLVAGLMKRNVQRGFRVWITIRRSGMTVMDAGVVNPFITSPVMELMLLEC